MWNDRNMKRSVVFSIGFAIALGAGCATTRAPGTRPDDMSHAEHVKAAKRFQEDARRHENRFDPNAEHEIQPRSHRNPHDPLLIVPEFSDTVTVNPTSRHLDHAKRRREIARQHAAAARALTKYEQKYCTAVPVAQRKAHPLPGQLARADNIAGGVRLHLKRGINANLLLRRMACHVAHARLKRFSGAKDCPIHLRGVGFRVVSGGAAIDLIAKRSSLVPELRRRTRVLLKR